MKQYKLLTLSEINSTHHAPSNTDLASTPRPIQDITIGNIQEDGNWSNG